MVFKKIDGLKPAADYIAEVILNHLQKNDPVTWLVTGGSAIGVAAEIAKKLNGQDLSDLSVILTDERYVPRDDADSNWKQLLDAGFSLPGAQLYSVIDDQDINKNTEHYAEILHKILDGSGYKIGLFGMGPDGHIAALFPNLAQINEDESYAVNLDNSPKPPPLRMTMTIPAIKKLDEAVLFTRGAEKKTMIENLAQDLPPSAQPAQILKSLPKLTIFNDQIGEEA